MKNIIIILVLVWAGQVQAQEKYITKEGTVSFYSHTLIEDIKADNNQVLGIIDMESGNVSVKMLMRSFVFKKALMQEHFNENYMESEKYPKGSFKGKIENYDPDNISDKIIVKGMLNLHGEAKEIEVEASINKTEEGFNVKGDFYVDPADFKIKIPKVVKDNISKKIKVSYEFNFKPYNK